MRPRLRHRWPSSHSILSRGEAPLPTRPRSILTRIPPPALLRHYSCGRNAKRIGTAFAGRQRLYQSILPSSNRRGMHCTLQGIRPRRPGRTAVQASQMTSQGCDLEGKHSCVSIGRVVRSNERPQWLRYPIFSPSG